MRPEPPFRVDAVVHDPAIEVWLASLSDENRALAAPWVAHLRGLGDDVRECMHDGAMTACVGDAAFAYVAAYRAHVNVGFFRGALLPDPRGLLEGSGRLGRHVKLRPGIRVEGLEELIAAAVAEVRGGVTPTAGRARVA